MSEKTLRERLAEVVRDIRLDAKGTHGALGVTATDEGWADRILALLQEPDDSLTVCTCEWAHPVDGSIDPSWPAEIDPACRAHSEVCPEPTG